MMTSGPEYIAELRGLSGARRVRRQWSGDCKGRYGSFRLRMNVWVCR